MIEECPSPTVDAVCAIVELGAAVAAAREVDYQNVGTVEFLLDTSATSTFWK